MSEEFNWEKFSETLSRASRDETLRTMYFHITGWKESFRESDLSSDAWDLLDLLQDPTFTEFDDKMFRLTSTASVVNLGYLATWLSRRAFTTGATETVRGLRDYLDNHKFQMTDVLIIRGIHIDNAYEFEDGVKLSPLHMIPKEIASSLQNYLYPMVRDHNPSAAFITSYSLPEEGSEDDFFDNHLNPIYQNQELLRLVIAIFCNSGAPTPVARWSLLPDWVPFSGLLDSSYSTQLEIKTPYGEEQVSNEVATNAIELYHKLKALPSNVKAPIEIALWRLTQSMNTWNKEQKAIDLGVSLETFLTSKDTRDQLSLQFRVIGALLTGNTLEERLMHHDIFKALYNLRSSAVHNGTIGNSRFPIQGIESKIDSSKALSLATDLAKKAIRRYIELGGLSETEHKAFFLSAGGRTSD